MKTALEAAQTLTGEALERLARHYRILRQEGEGDAGPPRSANFRDRERDDPAVGEQTAP